MGRRIVAAIGGNALGETLPEQRRAAEETARVLAGLIQGDDQVVLVHGSGPQIGLISAAMTGLSRTDPDHPMAPLSVCTAMAQGYIGYDLQNTLGEELLRRGLHRPVVTLLTQVEVDPADPAFDHPDKPVGTFLTQAEAQEMARRGNPVMEDAGRGWRRAVASPRPKRVVELESIRTLLDHGTVVVAGGGGGIPVAAQGNALKGVGAVVDKDFTAALLARELDAQVLLILTGVAGVSVHYGKPNQRQLTHMTVPVAREYLARGEFAAGSMGPKVAAGAEFAQSGPGRRCVITDLEHAADALRGQAGTTIG